MHLLDSCNVLAINGIGLISVVCLVSLRSWGRNDTIGFVLCWLGCRSRVRNLQTTISTNHYMLLCTIWLSSNDWSSDSILLIVWNLSWIDSMIVVMMICSRVCVLVEVHKDVLDLSLLGRIHDHYYGGASLCRIDKASCSRTWHRLVSDELICIDSWPLRIWIILRIESLRIWACASLLNFVMCWCSGSSCCHEASSSSSWSLALWSPLRRLLSMLRCRMEWRILSKVGLRGILRMILISVILRYTYL